MKTATLLFALALVSVATDGATAQPAIKCPAGQTPFKGKCFSRYECCDESVCPAGTVFEFQDQPKCVPCAKAATQKGIEMCTGGDLDTVDARLNAEYKKMMAEFAPELTRELREAERAWVVFRDKFCRAKAALYEGGSIQGQILLDCKAAETRRQLERLAELRKEWSPR